MFLIGLLCGEVHQSSFIGDLDRSGAELELKDRGLQSLVSEHFRAADCIIRGPAQGVYWQMHVN